MSQEIDDWLHTLPIDDVRVFLRGLYRRSRAVSFLELRLTQREHRIVQDLLQYIDDFYRGSPL